MDDVSLHRQHSIGFPLSSVAPARTEQDDAVREAVVRRSGCLCSLLVQRHQRRVFNLVYRMQGNMKRPVK